MLLDLEKSDSLTTSVSSQSDHITRSSLLAVHPSGSMSLVSPVTEGNTFSKDEKESSFSKIL